MIVFLPHLGCLFRQKVIKYMNIFLEYKWFPDRCDKPLHFNLIFVNVGCEDSFLYLSICWLYDRYTSYLSPETLWRNKPLEIHAKILHYTAIVKNKTFLYKNVTKNYLTLAHYFGVSKCYLDLVLLFRRNKYTVNNPTSFPWS